MRVTEVRYAHHIGRLFQWRWMIDRRRKVPDTGAAALLKSKGFEVVNPKDFLTPAWPQETVELEPIPDVYKEEEKKTLPSCYVFTNIFSPPAGVAQIQNLTNTIVRPTLPQSLLEQVTENAAEEDERVKEAILHAHLLDSHQEKLPRIWDVINRPGRSFPREYGAPVRRKNKSLSYQLILLLDQLFPEAAARNLAENSKLRLMLKHSGKLMQLQHKSAYMLSSLTPISSPFTRGEIPIDNEVEVLPDIHPVSPFLHCKQRQSYDEDEIFDLTSSKKYYPHTVFVHLNMPRMPHSDDSYCGITLLKAFSHAAAYAKLCGKVDGGDLEKPVVLQIVHTNGTKYHLGVYQLNTLDLTGTTKNVFWSHPLEVLYDKCNFKAAEGILEGYNPNVFSLLKAFHLQ